MALHSFSRPSGSGRCSRFQRISMKAEAIDSTAEKPIPKKRPRMKGMLVPSGISLKPNSGSMRKICKWRYFTIRIMMARTTDTAVNIEITIPSAMVTAKPRTGPLPT